MRAVSKHFPLVSGLLLALGLVFGLPRAPAPVDGQPLLEAGFGGIGSSSQPKFNGGTITRALTSTVASGSSAIVVAAGAKIDLNGGGGTINLYRDTNGRLRTDADVTLGNSGVVSITGSNGILMSGQSYRAWLRQAQTGVRDVRDIGITSAAGQVAYRTGSSDTDANGADASDLWTACTDCTSASPVTKWRATGKGAMQSLGVTSASNNLAGALACDSTNVGTEVWYSDTSTSKISKCACEQTGAGTFVWGAVTSTGDCT